MDRFSSIDIRAGAGISLCSGATTVRCRHHGCGTLFIAQPETGFSLIELMLATVILLVGIVSIMSMVLFALSTNYASKIEAAALRLSQQKLEELRSLPIDDAKLLGPGSPLDSQGNIDFSANPDPLYSYSTSLTLNRTKNTTLHFETRWNVVVRGAEKIITVATHRVDGNPGSFKPVNLKVAKAP